MDLSEIAAYYSVALGMLFIVMSMSISLARIARALEDQNQLTRDINETARKDDEHEKKNELGF